MPDLNTRPLGELPALRVTVDPGDSFATGASTQIAPLLSLQGAELTDLATLAVWINGREVTRRLDPDSAIAKDGGLLVQLPSLGFGSGLHHVRASVASADGVCAGFGEAYYEIGNAGPAQSVIDPRGDLLVPPEGGGYGYGCCKKGGGGGHGGGTPPGGGVPPVQPPDDGGGNRPPGEPEPGDRAKPNPDCKLVGIREIDPGPVVSEDQAKVSVDFLTEPADAELEFSTNLVVTYIAVTQFLLAGRDLATVTRADLSRKGAIVLQEVSLRRDGFANLVGPRKIEILISQINDFFRSSGNLPLQTFQLTGVPTRVRFGVRCKGGGRKANVTLSIRDA